MGSETPQNCQHEPHYRGLATVMFSIRYPDMTCHHASGRCGIEAPHLIAECAEFVARSPRAGNGP